MRRHADQKTFVRPEDRLDTVRMNVRLQLRINDFGSQQQSEFAEFRELSLLEIADSCRVSFSPCRQRQRSGGTSTITMSSAASKNDFGMVSVVFLPVIACTFSLYSST